VRGHELVICTRGVADSCPPLLSQLAAAAAQRAFVPNATVPLGDGPFGGLAFTYLEEVSGVATPQWPYGLPLWLFIRLSPGELSVCKTHGTPHVRELLIRSGVFPYSVRDRAGVIDLTLAGFSVLDDVVLMFVARTARPSHTRGSLVGCPSRGRPSRYH